jgi:hypothetical protein
VVDGIGLTVVDLIRCHQADPDMVMLLIVPIEKAATEAFGVLDAAEALREARLILEGFEDGTSYQRSTEKWAGR